VLIADLSDNARAHVSRRQAALVDLFASALARARGLGYSAQEIRAALTRAVAHAEDRPRVAFVAAEPAFMERYIPFLSDALADLRVEVFGVSLQDLREHGESALHPFGPPWCVATLVRSYAEVVQLLRDSTTPIIGLALELAPETQSDISSLPSDARAVLVAERINVIGMAHLIEQYWLPPGGIPHVSMEGKELPAALATANVIIHSLRARRVVTRRVSPGCRLIELRFVFSPLSLARLRQAIGPEAERQNGSARALVEVSGRTQQST
jgi:hypothetical protein